MVHANSKMVPQFGTCI